jgi:hypothetical protein
MAGDHHRPTTGKETSKANTSCSFEKTFGEEKKICQEGFCKKSTGKKAFKKEINKEKEDCPETVSLCTILVCPTVLNGLGGKLIVFFFGMLSSLCF